MGPMTEQETEAVLARVQTQMVETLELLHLARAKIAVLETANELLALALENATKAEGERIYSEFERRWPAARRGA